MDAESDLTSYRRYSRYEPRRRGSSRKDKQPPRAGRPRKRVWFPILALLFLSPAIYSWGQMAVQPSNQRIFARTVEWIRLRPGGDWLVNKVEYYNATWFHTPTKYTNATPSSIGGASGSVQLLARVVGRVQHNGDALRFQVRDVKGSKPTRIWIDYTGTVPQNFHTNEAIFLKGSVSSGVFTAAADSLQAAESGNQPSQHHPTGSYRPPDIKPVFTYHLPGEGVWKPTGPPVNGGPPVLVTTFRSETAFPQITAYVAWFDHTRTASAYYPGRYEPPNHPLQGPAMIPFSQRWRLLATFNGGFIYTDGLNGDGLNGVTNEPFKAGNATVVGYKNGAVNIISWRGGTTLRKNMAWARQSLPLIVDNGKPNPALDLSTDWGYTLGNAVRVWRTGLGIDKKGNLIYVAASDQTVISLADILVHAGAVRGMELDINPEWYTIITYRHHNGLIPKELAANYQQGPNRYLQPDDRDFFAIYRRLPGKPITVPLK